MIDIEVSDYEILDRELDFDSFHLGCFLAHAAADKKAREWNREPHVFQRPDCR